ncbi:hypothetical protein [Sphingomonas faeni]|uniref:hypothetical protein n=1 Tax=Sphingomonas faeni TaxID=185950 RepID=UPI00334ED5F8
MTRDILNQDQPDYTHLPYSPNMARATMDRWLYGDEPNDEQAEAEAKVGKADPDKARDMARRRLERTRYLVDRGLDEQRDALYAAQSTMFRFD